MSTLPIADDGTLADLVTYLDRARRVDDGGAVRLVARDGVLAVYVSPVHGGGGPTVLGLRVLPLAGLPVADGPDVRLEGLDVTVPLSAMADRFARRPASGSGEVVELAVPPAQAVGVSWAGVLPPRAGWRPVGAVPGQVLLDAAGHGIAQVAAGAGQGAGRLAVARLRAQIWGRDLAEPRQRPGTPQLPGTLGTLEGQGVARWPLGAGVPAGAAYAAQALGFVAVDEPVALHICGPWRRLSTSRGHVLARPARF